MRRIFFIITLLILFLNLSYSDEFIIDEPQSNESPPPRISSVSPSSKSSEIKKIGTVSMPATYPKGGFYGEVEMYENGGIGTRFVVGIFDIFEIGFTENIDSLIGSEPLRVNIPGAYMKLTILKNFKTFNWAIGFDSFGYGRNGAFVLSNGNIATIYGFFTTFGWSHSLFGGKDFLVFGLRYPLLPVEAQDPKNSSLFFGLSLSAPQYFSFGITLENIYISFDRGDRILPSFVFSIKPVSEFVFNFILQYEIYSQRLNRLLTIGYETRF